MIGRVPEGTQADVDRAVGAARAARLGWRGKDLSTYTLDDYTRIRHAMINLD